METVHTELPFGLERGSHELGRVGLRPRDIRDRELGRHQLEFAIPGRLVDNASGAAGSIMPSRRDGST
jgi:hypothetical protein